MKCHIWFNVSSKKCPPDLEGERGEILLVLPCPPSALLEKQYHVYKFCAVKAPSFKCGDETALNFLWFDAIKN
jgi:hypothetical protein